MEVEFLGVGSALCPRRNASLLIGNLVIDIGPLIYPLLIGRDIKHVLLTHAHGDHILGLWHFLHFRTFNDSEKVKVYGSKSTLERAKQLLEATIERSNLSRLLVEWQEVENTFQVEDQTIFTKVLPHSGEIKTNIYRIGKLAYATDVIDSLENVSFYKGIEVLIHGVGKKEHNHTPVEEVIEIAKQAGVRRLYLTHYCEEEELAEDWVRWAQEGEIINV
ncbi:MAG: MBL fold metallo-hydrolase [Candidatus Micrarchaeota archaeon]|nr:MBL fold metallo-hydrolase [Candidatus Micrarchaeota archaeon]